MELLEGRPLNLTIPVGGLSLDDFFEFSAALADVLATAHKRGFGHRGLTSRNVLVTDANGLKLTGLGSGEAQPGTKHSEPSFREDIAAFGLICCEMLLGRTLRTEEAARTVQRLALREDPDFISRWRPEVPVEISRLISRCVQSPGAGAHAAREVQNQLVTLKARWPAGELTLLPLSPAAARGRQTIVNWTLVLIVLNLIIALVALFFWKR